MKKIITLLGTTLLLAAIGLTTTIATAASANAVSARAQATPEKPLAKAAADALVAELTIGERQAGDVTILDLEGKLTDSGGTATLRNAIRRLLDEGNLKILLNLKSVSDVDESGVGELVASYNASKAANGTLKLLNLPKFFNDLLMVTKFLTVFQIYDNENEAIASFS
jgi:anti-sigma B factor antagonist